MQRIFPSVMLAVVLVVGGLRIAVGSPSETVKETKAIEVPVVAEKDRLKARQVEITNDAGETVLVFGEDGGVPTLTVYDAKKKSFKKVDLAALTRRLP